MEPGELGMTTHKVEENKTDPKIVEKINEINAGLSEYHVHDAEGKPITVEALLVPSTNELTIADELEKMVEEHISDTERRLFLMRGIQYVRSNAVVYSVQHYSDLKPVKEYGKKLYHHSKKDGISEEEQQRAGKLFFDYENNRLRRNLLLQTYQFAEMIAPVFNPEVVYSKETQESLNYIGGYISPTTINGVQTTKYDSLPLDEKMEVVRKYVAFVISFIKDNVSSAMIQEKEMDDDSSKSVQK